MGGEMEGRTFSWFPKLTEQIDQMPDEIAGEFALAVLRYGTYGIEPEFDDWTLRALFVGMKDDIDNSVSRRENGRKGGRPRKNPDGQTEVPETENHAFENEKPGFSECETGVSEVSETCAKPENPNQAKPSQYSPDQYKGTPYPLACLAALNEELRGLCDEFIRNPHGGFLAGFEGRVSVDDVRRMVRFKRREWEGTRFQANLNPGTLFSPDHFEAYLSASKQPKPSEGVREDEEHGRYDQEF